MKTQNLPKLIISITLISCFFPASGAASEEASTVTMKLASSAFEHQSDIPKQFTCDGKDISPALSWTAIPNNAKSLALVVDDPDAPDPVFPVMTWVHWVLYNIPDDSNGLTENISPQELPQGTLQGKNDWKRTGYRGPCPPRGKHRYFFKLYALDIVLPDLQTPDKAHLEKAMKGHIIAHAELTGAYKH